MNEMKIIFVLYFLCEGNLEAKIREMESRLGDSTATTKEKEVAISDINQVQIRIFEEKTLGCIKMTSHPWAMVLL
jgi:hypothetical protein